jgi:hypothetical protein
LKNTFQKLPRRYENKFFDLNGIFTIARLKQSLWKTGRTNCPRENDHQIKLTIYEESPDSKRTPDPKRALFATAKRFYPGKEEDRIEIQPSAPFP